MIDALQTGIALHIEAVESDGRPLAVERIAAPDRDESCGLRRRQRVAGAVTAVDDDQDGHTANNDGGDNPCCHGTRADGAIALSEGLRVRQQITHDVCAALRCARARAAVACLLAL